MGGAGTALAEGGHQQHDLDGEGRLRGAHRGPGGGGWRREGVELGVDY